MTVSIALQLYTVRDELERNFTGTFRQIADIGYRGVEIHDFYGLKPQEVKKICDDLGISIVSQLAYFQSLINNCGNIISDAKTLGNNFVACPYLPVEYRNTDGFRYAARILNEAGKELKKEGLTLCYHNHAYEFENAEHGQIGFDIIFQQTDPDFVKAELDVFWLRYANRDILAAIQSFGDRCPLLHLKDMAAQGGKNFTELGRGIIDIPSIIEKAISVNTRYLIVEQDAGWSCSPIESIRTSYSFIRQTIASLESKE